jgi:hypothetical protein
VGSDRIHLPLARIHPIYPKHLSVFSFHSQSPLLVHDIWNDSKHIQVGKLMVPLDRQSLRHTYKGIQEEVSRRGEVGSLVVFEITTTRLNSSVWTVDPGNSCSILGRKESIEKEHPLLKFAGWDQATKAKERAEVCKQILFASQWLSSPSSHVALAGCQYPGPNIWR